jgi:hypothetical protein
VSRVGTRRRGGPGAVPVDACRGAGGHRDGVVRRANRVGGEVGRLERAERLSFLLNARAQELTAALAELAALHPDNRAVPRVRAAAVDWQAALDTKQSLLAAGDLVAANRVDRAQVDPRFDRLAWLLRTTAADYSRAAGAAQGRSKAGALAVVAATLLSLAPLWRVERARSRLRAAEARAWEERGRLVNKILTVAERQRSGMAAELHDGPIQGLTRLGLALERGQLRLRRGQLEEGRQLIADPRPPWPLRSNRCGGSWPPCARPCSRSAAWSAPCPTTSRWSVSRPRSAAPWPPGSPGGSPRTRRSSCTESPRRR